MESLPASLASRFKELAARGEKLKQSLRTASTWVLLSDKALYLGDPLERYPRSDISGIEFDRAGAGPGTMIFLSGSEPLARIDFQGSDRKLLAKVEKALSPRRKLVQVFLEQDDYAPGERIRGHVEVEWPKAAPVRGVRIGLVGTEETAITVSTGSGKHRSTRTFTEEDPQIAEEWILFGGDRIGWMQAAKEALSSVFGTQDYPVLAAGRHRFPFEIDLPSDALPSHDGDHASVTYRLYAQVDVPLGFDKVFEGTIAVVEPREATVTPRTYEDEREAQGFLKRFSAELRMGLLIRKGPYHYGERLQVRLRVENLSQKKMRSAELCLFVMEYARAGGHDRETRTDLNSFVVKFPDRDAESHDYDLDLAVPAWPVPYEGRYSRVELWLSATLDIAMAFDATITVPVEIE